MLEIRKDIFANERDDNLNVIGKGIQPPSPTPGGCSWPSTTTPSKDCST